MVEQPLIYEKQIGKCKVSKKNECDEICPLEGFDSYLRHKGYTITQIASATDDGLYFHEDKFKANCEYIDIFDVSKGNGTLTRVVFALDTNEHLPCGFCIDALGPLSGDIKKEFEKVCKTLETGKKADLEKLIKICKG